MRMHVRGLQTPDSDPERLARMHSLCHGSYPREPVDAIPLDYQSSFSEMTAHPRQIGPDVHFSKETDSPIGTGGAVRNLA